jgi:hypothetical protein
MPGKPQVDGNHAGNREPEHSRRRIMMNKNLEDRTGSLSELYAGQNHESHEQNETQAGQQAARGAVRAKRMHRLAIPRESRAPGALIHDIGDETV